MTNGWASDDGAIARPRASVGRRLFVARDQFRRHDGNDLGRRRERAQSLSAGLRSQRGSGDLRRRLPGRRRHAARLERQWADNVFVDVAGAQFTATTGANGYYYIAVPEGSIATSGTPVLAYTTGNNASTGATLGASLTSATGTTQHLDVWGDTLIAPTTATTLSGAPATRFRRSPVTPTATTTRSSIRDRPGPMSSRSPLADRPSVRRRSARTDITTCSFPPA